MTSVSVSPVFGLRRVMGIVVRVIRSFGHVIVVFVMALLRIHDWDFTLDRHDLDRGFFFLVTCNSDESECEYEYRKFHGASRFLFRALVRFHLRLHVVLWAHALEELLLGFQPIYVLLFRCEDGEEQVTADIVPLCFG